MKYTKKADLLLHVIIPVFAGSIFYVFKNKTSIVGFARNQLPDGLWAYAFISCILIIWNRTINIVWVTITFLLAAVFEWLQYLHIIKGSADWYDIAAYFIFFGCALLMNKYLNPPYDSTGKLL